MNANKNTSDIQRVVSSLLSLGYRVYIPIASDGTIVFATIDGLRLCKVLPITTKANYPVIRADNLDLASIDGVIASRHRCVYFVPVKSIRSDVIYLSDSSFVLSPVVQVEPSRELLNRTSAEFAASNEALDEFESYYRILSGRLAPAGATASAIDSATTTETGSTSVGATNNSSCSSSELQKGDLQ